MRFAMLLCMAAAFDSLPLSRRNQIPLWQSVASATTSAAEWTKILPTLHPRAAAGGWREG